MLLFLSGSSAMAYFSLDETCPEPVNTFSPNFSKAYEAAKFGSGPPNETKNFESLLSKFHKPDEQAELNLTLGVICGQRTDLIDYRKSIIYFSEGLKYKLPRPVLVKIYLWRGNSFELLAKVLAIKEMVRGNSFPWDKDGTGKTEMQRALDDYIRGLEICLSYDLPEKTPPRPTFSRIPSLNDNSEENLAIIHEQRKMLAQHQLISEMLVKRYYYVDAIKRLLKEQSSEITEQKFKSAVSELVRSKTIASMMLKRVAGLNSRPDS